MNFHELFLGTRKMNPTQEAILMDIHIVRDREAVWILSAFIGNTIDTATPWTPILDKV